MRPIAVRSTADLIDRGAPAVYDESDPQFAQETIPSNLKLIEVLLQNAPKNKKLLLRAAEGFGGYSLLFLQDTEPERAKGFYLRGKDYALRALRPALKNQIDSSVDDSALQKALQNARATDVPALFWAAFDWAGMIQLSMDSPQALAELPKVASLMRRVDELDPKFHFAGPELFFGVYYASRPAPLGGNPAKAEAFFKNAKELTQGKFLMAYVLEARYAAVALQDKALFESLLKTVADSPAGALPESLLTDQVAKIKAKTLLDRENDYF